MHKEIKSINKKVSEAQEDAKSTHRTINFMVGILGLFVLIVALGGYGYITNQKLYRTIEGMIMQQNLEQEKLQTQLSALKQQFDAMQENIAVQVARQKIDTEEVLNQKWSELSEGMDDAIEKKFQALDNHRWLLLKEIKGLVHLAKYHMTLLNDKTLAVEYLKKADMLALSVNDDKFSQLHNELLLAQHRTKTTVVTDVEAVWLKLEQLIQTVSKAEKIEIIAPKEEAVVTTAPIQNVTNWKERLKITWLELKDLVKIRKRDDGPLIAGIVNHQIWPLQASLLLEEARWAVLHRKEDIYQQSLLAASQIIKLNRNKIKKFQPIEDEINQLLSMQLESITPDYQELSLVIDDLLKDESQ